MLTCDVVPSGKVYKATLTVFDEDGFDNRYPSFRLENGVKIQWWDFETGKPIEKLKWEFKKKLLLLPIPGSPGSLESRIEELKELSGVRLESNPKSSRPVVSNPDIIKISVPTIEEELILGTLRMGKKSLSLLKDSVALFNKGMKYSNQKPKVETGVIFDEMYAPAEDKVEPDFNAKFEEEINKLQVEVEHHMDKMSSHMAAVNETRKRISFLVEMRKSWEVPPIDDFFSDIGDISKNRKSELLLKLQ